MPTFSLDWHMHGQFDVSISWTFPSGGHDQLKNPCQHLHLLISFACIYLFLFSCLSSRLWLPSLHLPLIHGAAHLPCTKSSSSPIIILLKRMALKANLHALGIKCMHHMYGFMTSDICYCCSEPKFVLSVFYPICFRSLVLLDKWKIIIYKYYMFMITWGRGKLICQIQLEPAKQINEGSNYSYYPTVRLA